jgi:hypothetical protein
MEALPLKDLVEKTYLGLWTGQVGKSRWRPLLRLSVVRAVLARGVS